MKILLINPEKEFLPPMGLLYIAAVLERKNHNVKIINFLNTRLNKFKNTQRNALLFEKSIAYSPDIIGITCMSSQSFSVKCLINNYRKRLPDTLIVVGGPHPIAKPKELLDSGADFTVIGEGEETFPDLIDTIKRNKKIENVKGIAFKKNKKLIVTKPRSPIQNLDTLPFPAYHLIDYESYIDTKMYGIRGLWIRCGRILTSRGCPGRCIFCNTKLTHGKCVRNRSIRNVVDEIEFLIKRYKIKGFWIMDDTFTLSEERVIEFCNELKRRSLKLKWSCQTRVNTLTERMAVAMKNSGCVQAEFGVESGSQKILDLLKKDITIEQTKKAFKICHKYDIRPFATVMIGSPGETKEDIKLTKELIKEIKPAHTGYFFTTPYPGTELYNLAIKNKWIDPKKYVWWVQTEDPVMCINFTKDELIKIRDLLYKDTLDKTLLNLLKSPSFIFFLTKLSIKRPSFLFNMTKLLLAKKGNDTINLFKNEILLNN